MQKNSNPSKKNTVSAGHALSEQYRSEGSRGSLSGVKPKDGIAMQNLKEFKCEIDHEIAKCLDTLDRQGLKFLRETLRASKIFGLNTQQLGNTQPIEENISVEQQSPPQKTQAVKKIEPVKQSIQIKKVVKPDLQRKGVATSKGTRASTASEGKNDLGDKIHKKLEGLNIKSGKKIEQKPTAAKPIEQSDKVRKIEVKPAQQIAEQIQVDQIQEQPKNSSIIREELSEEKSDLREETSTNTNKQSGNIKKASQVKISLRQENMYRDDHRQKTDENQMLKPFCKKPIKKYHEENKHHNHNKKDYGIEITKEDQIKGAIKIKTQGSKRENESEQNQKSNEQQDQIIEEDHIMPRQIEPLSKRKLQHEQIENIVNQSSENPTNYRQSDNKEEIDSDLFSLITKINKLSPNKRQKLEKMIEKLQHSKKDSVTNSILSSQQNQKEVSYYKPYIAQRGSFVKNDNRERSKSRSKMQKHEKATSLQNSIVRKIHQPNVVPQTLKHKQDESEVDISVQELSQVKQKQENIPTSLDRQENVISQMIPEQRVSPNPADFRIEEKESNKSNLKSSNTFRLKEDNLSGSITLGGDGQKLIKISKKKSSPTSICIKILSNNGHSSSVGLSSVQLFNISGQTIAIDESNLKSSSNAKTLKLFSDNSGQNWIVPLSAATINIENIMIPIAGIRIVNLNKSQLDNSKQADLAQIFLNDQLHWRGQLKGGSYKENQVYLTDIKVAGRQFQFPKMKNLSQVSIGRAEEKVESVWADNFSKFKKQKSVNQKNSNLWLEKETVQLKMKQLEEQQRSQVKTKKIQSIRMTNANISEAKKEVEPLPTFEIRTQFNKPVDFGNLKNNNDQVPVFKDRYPQKQSSSKIHLQSLDNEDILGELSKGIGIRKKTLGREENISQTKKKEEVAPAVKEKEQDQEFEKILLSMEQRQKPKEERRPTTPKKVEPAPSIQTFKNKAIAQKNFDDFMKDSLFDDNPKPKKFESTEQRRRPQQKKQETQIKPNYEPKKAKAKDIDNLIDELNDMIGADTVQETGEEFYIPELPTGTQLTFIFLSNWGNQSLIGLNGIELFDSQGNIVKPTEVSSPSVNSRDLYQKLFKNELLTSDEKMQIKLQKNKKIVISLNFKSNVELAALRIWNYNGHRVHNNIGVKKCHIKFDNNYIFSGQIQQSSGSSEDAYKYCEYILFTESPNILKKINEKDWLSRIKKKQEEQNKLFKTTLQNFHRPSTKNDEEAVKKPSQQVEIRNEPIKLPKRQCFEYDPPLLPEGFVLKFVLHGSWGDRFFIGLNGIEVFNDKGENITTKGLSQIRADPSSISKIEGYQRDKRVINNLINGNNNTTSDNNIWLAPFLSDVEKIEHGRPNIILMEYSKANRISGINFYNYTKTPQRGVREIEIFIDSSLLYRGYLRKYSSQEGIIHTTINFTKDLALLEAMSYIGYNEDHLEQEVALINEEKIIRATNINMKSQKQLSRPMTGKLLN